MRCNVYVSYYQSHCTITFRFSLFRSNFSNHDWYNEWTCHSNMAQRLPYMYREAWSNIENDQTIFCKKQPNNPVWHQCCRGGFVKGLREDGKLTLVGHLPRDLVRLMTVVTNEELEMSTCEVVYVDDVPVRTPGLRGLQIAVMLKLRLTNDSKKKRISILSVILL